MLKSSLCHYSDTNILLNGTITITGAGADDAAKRLDERNKRVIFKNCTPFINCISEYYTQIDNAKYVDVVMRMYNLIKYSIDYLETSESLWKYYRDYPNVNITQSESFKFKIKITGKNPAAGNTKDVEIAVLLKYLIKVLENSWNAILIDCEINLILTWSEDCVISSGTRATKFKITHTKLYVGFVKILQTVHQQT